MYFLEGKNGIQFGNVAWEREFAGAFGSCSFPTSWFLNFGQEVTLQDILWFMVVPGRCCLLREGAQGDITAAAPRGQTLQSHIPAASERNALFL